MGKINYKGIRLPERVIEEVDDTVQKSRGIFSSRADLVKQATLKFIDETKAKLNIYNFRFDISNNSIALITA